MDTAPAQVYTSKGRVLGVVWHTYPDTPIQSSRKHKTTIIYIGSTMNYKSTPNWREIIRWVCNGAITNKQIPCMDSTFNIEFCVFYHHIAPLRDFQAIYHPIHDGYWSIVVGVVTIYVDNPKHIGGIEGGYTSRVV